LEYPLLKIVQALLLKTAADELRKKHLSSAANGSLGGYNNGLEKQLNWKKHLIKTSTSLEATLCNTWAHQLLNP